MLRKLILLLLLASPLLAIDCNTFPNATVPSNTDPNACQCANGFTWNSAASPIGCYRNCPSVPHSNSTNNGSAQCFCVANYYWNVGNSSCQINCSSIGQTNGSINSTDCICRTNYYWNTTEPSCWLNCSIVANANATIVEVNNTECICNDGYVWNASTKMCDRDCNIASNATNKTADPLVCECRKGYTWSNDSCTLDCSNVSYSNGSANTLDGACICKEGYRWDKYPFSLCVADTSSKLVGLAYGLGLGVPLGLALIAGLGVLIYVLVMPRGPNQAMMQTSMSMFQPQQSQSLLIPQMMITQPARSIIRSPVGYPASAIYRPQVYQQPVIVQQQYTGLTTPSIIRPQVVPSYPQAVQLSAIRRPY